MENLAANPPTALPLTGMFQRAHGRFVILQRVDEQIAGLLEQRRKLQEELRAMQAQINEEFNHALEPDGKIPARLLPDPEPVVN